MAVLREWGPRVARRVPAPLRRAGMCAPRAQFFLHSVAALLRVCDECRIHATHTPQTNTAGHARGPTNVDIAMTITYP